MKKIRDLRVRMGNDIVVSASYLMDEDGTIWYQEDGSEIEPYIGHLYGCSECKHCIFNAKTENDIYQVRPLPPLTCKCDLMDFPDYDITFKSDYCNAKHPVCKHFKLAAQNYSEDNVNQFIDIKNSCVHYKLASIQGMSYKGRQAPFTFSVAEGEWETMSFVSGTKVRMLNSVIWNTYKTPEGIRTGAGSYIEVYKNLIDKERHGEIRNAFKLNWIECYQMYGGKVFDFEKMWFV